MKLEVINERISQATGGSEHPVQEPMEPERGKPTVNLNEYQMEAVKTLYLQGFLNRSDIAPVENLLFPPSSPATIDVKASPGQVLPTQHADQRPQAPISDIQSLHTSSPEFEPPIKVIPRKEKESYSLLNSNDLEKITEGNIKSDSHRLTLQDIQLVQYMLTHPFESNIVDIALQINPRQRDAEVAYLEKRMETLNWLFRSSLGLQFQRNVDDESLISLITLENMDQENMGVKINEFLEKEKDKAPNRLEKYIKANVYKTGDYFTLEAVTRDGKKLHPLPIKSVRLEELPPNAISNDSGKGTVTVEDNNGMVAQEVGATTTEVGIGEQVKLITLLLLNGKLSYTLLRSKLSTAEEPLSKRKEQLLFHLVNLHIRKWGIEVTHDDDDESVVLQIAGEEQPILPPPIVRNYDEDNAFFENRQRRRKPSHGKMRL